MNLAVVLARGNSKRIPGKNLKMLCGHPLVAWPILSALEASIFDEILVSTDDENIARVANQLGATVMPRSAKNASDFSPVTDVVNEVIQLFENQRGPVSSVTAFLGTAVFADSALIKEAFALFKGNPDFDFVIPVQPFHHSLDRSLKIEASGTLKPAFQERITMRSQDTEEYFHDAGQFYMARQETWKSVKSPFLSRVKPMVLRPWAAIDIDTQEDFEIAESIKRFQITNSLPSGNSRGN